MKKCLIVTGGRISFPFADKFLKENHYDHVIAVDAGLLKALELGLTPDLAVGDFDTLGKEKLEELKKNRDFRTEVHIPEKDETDTELAFMKAAEAGMEEVHVLGATGGRLDHELSNIYLLLSAQKHGLKTYLYDEQNKIFLIDSSVSKTYEFLREGSYGKYISFLPMTEKIKGLTLTGFKYPLQEKDLSIYENPGLCVSNEILEEKAVLSLKDGILIGIESRDQ